MKNRKKLNERKIQLHCDYELLSYRITVFQEVIRETNLIRQEIQKEIKLIEDKLKEDKNDFNN